MKKKILLTISFLLVLIPFIINVFSIIRMVSLLLGIILFTYTLNINKKFNILMCLYVPILFFVLTYTIDYTFACVLERNPIYAISNKSNDNVIVYNSILYRVFNCNEKLSFDNNYQKNYMCKTSLINSIDINEVLSDADKFYKDHKHDFVKITGKVSKINGNSSIELNSYTVDSNNTLNGYVIFDKENKLNIKINNKMDVSHYKIYDYITVVGEVSSYELDTTTLKNVVIEDNDIYTDYTLSVIEPEKCGDVKEYTEGYFTYCLSNIYVDYGIDKYELSYTLKDKKITFDNLKKNYEELKENDSADLYLLNKFNILVCDDSKTIFINKNVKKPFSLCKED